MTTPSTIELAHHTTIPAEEAWAHQESREKIAALRQQIATEHLAHDFGNEARDYFVGKYGKPVLDRVLQQRAALEAAGQLNTVDADGKETLVGRLNLVALLEGLTTPELALPELERFGGVRSAPLSGLKVATANSGVFLGWAELKELWRNVKADAAPVPQVQQAGATIESTVQQQQAEQGRS